MKRLNTEVHYQAIAIFGLCIPRETKAYIHTNTCTQVLIGTLFRIAKKFKQPKCSSIDEEIKSVNHIMKYYSAIKGSTVTCYNMNEHWKYYAEEASQKIPHILWFHLQEVFKNRPINRNAKLLPTARGFRMKWGVAAYGYGVFFLI